MFAPRSHSRFLSQLFVGTGSRDSFHRKLPRTNNSELFERQAAWAIQENVRSVYQHLIRQADASDLTMREKPPLLCGSKGNFMLQAIITACMLALFPSS